MIEAIRAGDRRALSRAATLIERREAEPLIRELFPYTGRAAVWGITGAAGVGKSTLTDRLVGELRAREKTVAVIAVDPSSPFTGGALLGDRIRMTSHYADPGVFIRSMATRGAMGGLAAATADLTLLFDAAGFDFVLIETVGVGQDEVEIAGLAAVTVVVLAPGLGDGIQAIKAGLLEIATILVINKADRDGADALERDLHGADLTAPVLRTIASTGEGVIPVLDALLQAEPRGSSAVYWRTRLKALLSERLLEKISLNSLTRAAESVARRERDPYAAVHELLGEIFHEASAVRH